MTTPQHSEATNDRKPAGVIETHHMGEDIEWGYSFTSYNPEPADYVRCYDEESAWKLARNIEALLSKKEGSQ